MTVTMFDTRAEKIPTRSSIAAKDREKLADLLGQALSSTYVLYHKTQAFHWNVAGPLFFAVHNLTEKQYKELAEAIDDMAERIRAIGFPAPIGLAAYARDSAVSDVTEFPETGDMIVELARDHQTVANQLREIVKEAEKVDDVYTADLLTARVGAHEEAAWMLNSLLVQ